MRLFGRPRDHHESQRVAELERRVSELQRRLETTFEPPSSDPPRLADADEIEAAIAELRSQVARIDTQLGAFNDRLSAIASEFASQLDELGGELAGLVDGRAGDDVESRLADLRVSQTKLAAEQARYQIAFREDLASLADRLRR